LGFAVDADELRADGDDLGVVAEELGEELQGVFADEGVVVEEEEEFGGGGVGGLVVAAGEAEILGIFEKLDVGEIGYGAQGIVGGGVVYDDGFGSKVAAVFFDGGEKVAEHAAAVPVDDEDGDVGVGRRIHRESTLTPTLSLSTGRGGKDGEKGAGHFIALGEMWYKNRA